MKFGDNLKKLRKSKKLSQEDLAEKVMVSRQSVSKWETGDAYPEMNNILELCRIFKCDISTLVNDKMVDLESLDDEVKMNVVKFKEDKQHKMKVLTKIIYIFARIGKILSRVGAICIGVVAVIALVLGCNTKVEDNNVTLFGEKINYERSNTEVKIIYNGEEHKITKQSDVNDLNDMFNYIEEHKNITTLTIFLDLMFISLIILLFISNRICLHLEKLFYNLHTGDTPFTLDNVEHIKKMCYLMIAIMFIPIFVELFATIVGISDATVSFNGISILSILVLFAFSYIFEYGYEIQLDSDGKMYGDTEE